MRSADDFCRCPISRLVPVACLMGVSLSSHLTLSQAFVIKAHPAAAASPEEHDNFAAHKHRRHHHHRHPALRLENQLGAPIAATAVAMVASTTDEPQQPDSRQGIEGVSSAGIRTLRAQIDEGATASQTIATILDGIIMEGQELLTTEASVILQRCPRIAEAAKAGELSAALSSAAETAAGAAGEFLRQNLEKEVVAELDTPWAVSVKKWRQKALAVEKYRSTNPTANAVVYTYMTNCCLRQGMWEVAYDALTYAGLMSAGPFFVSRKDVGLGGPSLVLDMDRMACYVAEKILDIDLDVWRRRGGDMTAGAGTVGNNKPGVGIEERNFSQNDDSASHLAALRVQDMTLATGRVALRKVRQELRDPPAGEGSTSLVILASATTNALFLKELLLPVRAIESLLALDFPEPVEGDAELGAKLSDHSTGVASSTLDLLTGASRPIVVSGDALRGWLAQPDDVKAEDAS
ncbi:unnamed protein product [Scytosiphon promiscuus]